MKTETLTDPYQIDDDHPTITYCVGNETEALPYHLVRRMRISESGSEIVVVYDDLEIKIRGRHLQRLWRELRAFRVKEVNPNGGAAATALGEASDRCLVESIVILEVAPNPSS